jgi:hypothetical protein
MGNRQSAMHPGNKFGLSIRIILKATGVSTLRLWERVIHTVNLLAADGSLQKTLPVIQAGLHEKTEN